MAISLTPQFSELDENEALPVAMLSFLAAEYSHELHQAILREFIRQRDENGLTQRKLAKRIRKGADQVNRILGAPSNLTAETVSAFLAGLGKKLAPPRLVDLRADARSAQQENAQPVKAVEAFGSVVYIGQSDISAPHLFTNQRFPQASQNLALEPDALFSGQEEDQASSSPFGQLRVPREYSEQSQSLSVP